MGRRGAALPATSTMQLYRSDATSDYRGRATITNGTVQIQSYQPFRMDMQSRLLAQRRQGAFRPHGTRQRRRTNDRRPAKSTWADGRSKPTSSARASTFRRRKTSFFTDRNSTFRGRRFHRHVSSLQGRTRAQGLVRQCYRRRQRLAVSRTCADPCSGFPIGSRSRTRRASCTAARRNSTTGWRRSASRRLRARPGTSNTRRRSRDGSRISSKSRGCGMSGRASGRNRLEWPLGKWAVKTGHGEATVTPP